MTTAQTLYDINKANIVAEQLNAEDDWVYKVCSVSETHAKIEVYDEDGEKVGNL